MNKKDLRNKYLQIRNNMDLNHKIICDEMIIKKIINSLIFQKAKVIAVFFSINNEVNLKSLVINSWKLNKIVVFPRMTNNKTLIFKQVNNWNELIIDNSYKIAQPKKECLTLKLKDIDICFVPFLVYDFKGYRLGYGEGYYDRTLANFKNYIIGVGYSYQKVNKLLINKYDIAMHQLFTEKEIINF